MMKDNECLKMLKDSECLKLLKDAWLWWRCNHPSQVSWCWDIWVSLAYFYQFTSIHDKIWFFTYEQCKIHSNEINKRERGVSMYHWLFSNWFVPEESSCIWTLFINSQLNSATNDILKPTIGLSWSLSFWFLPFLLIKHLNEVLNATCDEHWGPHGAALSELANVTKKLWVLVSYSLVFLFILNMLSSFPSIKAEVPLSWKARMH
jgi:hypothetical protein